MRKVAIAVLLAFAVTLAVVIGNRMNAEAMAVVVGVVCGVAAGIPMSALLIWVMTRRSRQEANEAESRGLQDPHRGAYPPVVVIQGGTPAPSGLLPPFYASQPMAQEAVHRQFRIVGEQDD
jgi:hypothetical protein